MCVGDESWRLIKDIIAPCIGSNSNRWRVTGSSYSDASEDVKVMPREQDERFVFTVTRSQVDREDEKLSSRR